MDIQIKKGDYGVSWAIKRQLQEEGVNTKNINSCWTEIMNAFKGDNESKVNNQTIGEKWTSLKNNVECAVGQIIHIAEATWTKIKEVVAKAAGKTGGAESTKGSTGKKSSDAKAETITKDQCRETDATREHGIWYCEKNGKHYKEVNGKMKEITPRIGRITQFFEDGSWVERCDEKGNDYTIVKFDRNGNQIMRTEYKNDKPYITNSNLDSESGFFNKTRYHESGKEVRWGKRVKTFKNGDYVVWLDNSLTGYHGYSRHDSNGTLLYGCDKDGNRIE